ncbi:helix-turn-helix domain-containing protein [Methanoregula formicica]|uniref:Putative Zn peptidase n=1 Tax=Methanoregula formicica (strain DSM 22288 / NBRC 105244 / SMSP) TaxID=593750 RepID=L0HF57_METFS|nr:XRE family transcriptional regulator [Methanoregula formicica]AGB03367.1 putative Zn peptidase [Methanoregula formicica SMSP]
MSLGESIKLRRDVLGISLRDLADRIGVSHTTVNKYEKNILIPDSECLIRLSDILQIPISSLIRPQNDQIRLNPVAFRSKKLKKREEKQITAKTKEWLARYLQIERLSGSHRTFVMPKGFRRKIASFDEAEKAAKDLRKVWDLGSDPIENLTTLLEDKGIKIGIISGITKFDALFTECDDNPIIVLKKDLPRARQRFSLAHELGHCLLDVEGGLDEEKAMHRFAGAFLVPSEKVIFELGEKRHKLSLKELMLLKEKYGLSMAAWVYRAKDLGIISPALYVEVQKIFSRQGWKKEEPGDTVSGEVPVFMSTLVFKSHAEGLISTSKAAELLNQNISTFCSFEGESDFEQSAMLCG